MPTELMTQDAAASTLLAYAFAGGIGEPEGKGVSYALIDATPSTFAWSAALEDFDGPRKPIDRYRVEIDRRSKQVLPPQPIIIPDSELAEAILAATGQHFASSTRFTDGALSISYKVTVQDDPDIAYVVQLRHHGRVASMDSLMNWVSKNIDPRILPVPTVYPIPGELQRQEATGMGRQITRFIPGDMADSLYPGLSHEEKLILVQRIALAIQACWQIQLPEPRLIGELIGDEASGFSIGPDRHHGLGGPFPSVREYLRAHIRSSFVALEKQQGIKEYKERFQDRIEAFIHQHLDDIPLVVEDIPIVAMHTDMGLHNIILSSETLTEIRAIIDWEFVASAPYASLHPMIERLFRKRAANLFGPEFDRADELRDAFWDAIPDWKRWNQSVATQTFLEWFRFGLFMKPEPCLDNDISEGEKQAFWRENIRVVEKFLIEY
ncbi:MAG: hypothetical protein L6R39_007672 [Caloplaca ligustica]|nr:MAG: hypothetical protein L6R39_007672 [Caloplaca ligustica]